VRGGRSREWRFEQHGNAAHPERVLMISEQALCAYPSVFAMDPRCDWGGADGQTAPNCV